MKAFRVSLTAAALLAAAALSAPFAAADSCSATGVCCIWTCKPGCTITCGGMYSCATCINAYCNWYGGSEAADCHCVNCDTGKIRPVPVGDVILVIQRTAA